MPGTAAVLWMCVCGSPPGSQCLAFSSPPLHLPLPSGADGVELRQKPRAGSVKTVQQKDSSYEWSSGETGSRVKVWNISALQTAVLQFTILGDY